MCNVDILRMLKEAYIDNPDVEGAVMRQLPLIKLRDGMIISVQSSWILSNIKEAKGLGNSKEDIRKLLDTYYIRYIKEQAWFEYQLFDFKLNIIPDRAGFTIPKTIHQKDLSKLIEEHNGIAYVLTREQMKTLKLNKEISWVK